MKVVFRSEFHRVFSSDPASAAGRMKAVVDEIGADTEWIEPQWILRSPDHRYVNELYATLTP